MLAAEGSQLSHSPEMLLVPRPRTYPPRGQFPTKDREMQVMNVQPLGVKVGPDRLCTGPLELQPGFYASHFSSFLYFLRSPLVLIPKTPPSELPAHKSVSHNLPLYPRGCDLRKYCCKFSIIYGQAELNNMRNKLGKEPLSDNSKGNGTEALGE